MSRGYIYFFQAKDTEEARVKVGRSTDPQHRLRALSYETGYRLTVIGVMPSDKPVLEEQAILREFAEHHIEGEWFNSAVIPKISAYQRRFLKRLPQTQQLVQTWVSPEFYAACVAHAKHEGRTLANWTRRQLSKITGVEEE